MFIYCSCPLIPFYCVASLLSCSSEILPYRCEKVKRHVCILGGIGQRALCRNRFCNSYYLDEWGGSDKFTGLVPDYACGQVLRASFFSPTHPEYLGFSTQVQSLVWDCMMGKFSWMSFPDFVGFGGLRTPEGEQSAWNFFHVGPAHFCAHLRGVIGVLGTRTSLNFPMGFLWGVCCLLHNANKCILTVCSRQHGIVAHHRLLMRASDVVLRVHIGALEDVHPNIHQALEALDLDWSLRRRIVLVR